MSEARSLLDHINIKLQRPACPNCRSRMMLTHIMPARTGFDFRSFECPRCDHVHEVMVANEAFGMYVTT